MIEEQRKYLHTMANQMTIIDGSVNRALLLLKKREGNFEDEILRLEKAKISLDNMIKTITEFRAFVQKQECK